jgi:uncharacterized protein YdaU (DUF1376 family)
MFSYQHHIGDVMMATSHMAPLEDLMARRLRDMYVYLNGALPVDVMAVCRLVRANTKTLRSAAVRALREVFTVAPNGQGWAHAALDEQIVKAHGHVARPAVAGADALALLEAEGVMWEGAGMAQAMTIAAQADGKRNGSAERTHRSNLRRSALYKALQHFVAPPAFDAGMTELKLLAASLPAHQQQAVWGEVSREVEAGMAKYLSVRAPVLGDASPKRQVTATNTHNPNTKNNNTATTTEAVCVFDDARQQPEEEGEGSAPPVVPLAAEPATAADATAHSLATAQSAQVTPTEPRDVVAPSDAAQALRAEPAPQADAAAQMPLAVAMLSAIPGGGASTTADPYQAAADAMQRAGCHDARPTDAALRRLVDEGVQHTELVDAAQIAARKHKGMAYALGVLNIRRRDGAASAAPATGVPSTAAAPSAPAAGAARRDPALLALDMLDQVRASPEAVAAARERLATLRRERVAA